MLASNLNGPSNEVINSLDETGNDLVNWIDRVLADQTTTSSTSGSPSNLTNLDKRLSDVVAALEVASEDTTSRLGRLIDEISRGVPRLGYDLQFMREGALTLQDSLARIGAASTVYAADRTASALEQLHVLDSAKLNMEAARDVLREAESWSTIESEVMSLLGEHNYEKAATKLEDANKSMVVFHNTEEYESRHSVLVSLQNQLEAALSSALVAAIKAKDVRLCRDFFSIFSRIQREPEFHNYYIGSQRNPIVMMWQEACLSDCDSALKGPSDIATQSFAAFLDTCYTLFLSILATESESVPQIFPDPQATLTTLIVSTISALQPSFTQRLASVFRFYSDNALVEIIAAFEATERFAVEVGKIMDSLPPSVAHPSLSDATPDQAHRTSSRKRSSLSARFAPGRASMSGSGLVPVSSVDVVSAPEWELVLFQPFVDLQVEYESLERHFFKQTLVKAVDYVEHSSIAGMDAARVFRDQSSEILVAADSALSRCIVFTRGYGAFGLIHVVDSAVSAFIKATASRLVPDAGYLAALGEVSRMSPGDDVSDLDYTARDWSNMQHMLHLVDATRTVWAKICHFEDKLRTSLAELFLKGDGLAEDPLYFKPQNTSRGQVQLLAQSALNSNELRVLLHSLKSDARSRTTDSSSHLNPLGNGSDPTSFLFASTRGAITAFVQQCQSSIETIMLSPLRSRLTSYATLSTWTQTDTSSSSSGSSSELRVPAFSLSPTDTMQRIAEGLLNLPRLFEVYAEDDVLAFSLETLPFLDDELLKELLAQSSHQDSVGSGSRSRRSSSISSQSHLSQAQHLTTEAVLSAWLSSLGLNLLNYLTGDVLPNIRRLTTPGAAQLASDLGYLMNIIQALNVDSGDLLKWKAYMDMDDAEGEKQLAEKGTSDTILIHVARMRRW